MSIQSLLDYISIIPDIRQQGKVKHKLSGILYLTVCAVITGADEWQEIEDFGHERLEWLKKNGDFDNVIHVDDTILASFEVGGMLYTSFMGGVARNELQAITREKDSVRSVFTEKTKPPELTEIDIFHGLTRRSPQKKYSSKLHPLKPYTVFFVEPTVEAIQNKFPNEAIPADGKIIPFNIENGNIRGLNGLREVDFVIDLNAKLIIGKKHHLLGDRGPVQAAVELF